MADPTIQTFCCHSSNETDIAIKIMKEFNTDSYNVVCLTSSLIGMLGAIYQILPREQTSVTHRWITFSAVRGRKIIIWLAVADFFASLGIFTRSAIWIRNKNIMPALNDDSSVYFCAFSSAWTQYFYTATWFWTLCYAIDMRRILTEKAEKNWIFHLICWIFPAILTGIGLGLLYYPNAQCHTSGSLVSALIRIMPNYIATYVPITIVMIANPILYKFSTKDMERILTSVLGQFTKRERDIIDTIKLKFSLINAVFYFCWIPNLINGILLWSLWFHLPVKITISIWYIMACTNPLQAFLNCFVYRRWTKGSEKIVNPFRKCLRPREQNLPENSEHSVTSNFAAVKEENMPLLRSVPKASINRFSNSSYNDSFERNCI